MHTFRDVNKEFSVADVSPSPSLLGEQFFVPIPTNARGEAFSPISISTLRIYPCGEPILAMSATFVEQKCKFMVSNKYKFNRQNFILQETSILGFNLLSRQCVEFLVGF